jgi:ADP-ribose pyrophosphatase
MNKIPTTAEKVFDGIIFDVYHWKQEMFDGSVETFEAIRKKDTVTIIAVVGDKILVNDEEQPGHGVFQALPGGRCEEGSTPLEDAKRELAEETGYTADDWQEWFISDPWNAVKIEWNNHFFIARDCKKTEEQNLDPGEKITVNLLTFEEFLEFRHNPKARNKDLFQILEKAATDESEKQKLKELLFAPN